MPPERRHVRRGHPGTSYARRVIEKALRIKRTGRFSFAKIAILCGVRDPMTVWRWTQHSTAAAARRVRAARKGPRWVLTEEQESVALGWLIYRNDAILDTSVSRFRQFVKHMTEKS